jgi:outer membrane protein OmpA-like peptidoglycan-associated protein
LGEPRAGAPKGADPERSEADGLPDRKDGDLPEQKMFGNLTLLPYPIRQLRPRPGSKGDFMMAKRTVLLGMLICLTAAATFGQVGVGAAVVAPSNQGDIGLLTMPTADNPRAGQFTLGFYGLLQQQIAGPIYDNQAEQTRAYRHWDTNISFGIGLTNWWSLFASGGVEGRQNRGDWQGGVIEGIPIVGPFDVIEGQKFRVGTKFNYFSEADPSFRVAGWLAAHIPVSNEVIVDNNGDWVEGDLNARRTDWEWGAAGTKDWFTAMVSYTMAGRQDENIRPPNQLRFGIGIDIPVAPIAHVIIEIDRNIMDGGDGNEPDYSMLTAGGRFWFGQTGWGIGAAFNANMDMLISHGINPQPFGGLIGVTYAAWPPAPPPPVVMPAPEPMVEEQPMVQTATVPAPAPPPRPSPRMTSDEIFFDGKSARLTNIAKAVLDGVALRMKNDLNATAVVTGYTDNTGSEASNVELGQKRAEAAREYLVTRHGIDPGRIGTESRGAADPAYDNATAEGKAKNRRAQIVVTLVSGT